VPGTTGTANGEIEMATAQVKHHDYHLVDPSPWPIVGAVSAFIMAVGAIVWMHHMFAAAPIIFGVGAIGVLYTMAGWWADVIREAQYKGDHTRVVQISHRYGMILFIASEVMFFVAWFWAFFNSALFPADPVHATREALFGGVWPPKGIETFDPWHLPLLNTLLLLTSGTTVTWAHHALLENDRQGLKYGLILTIALGATFTCVQAYEYSHAAFSFAGNIYGATFFMATGFHGFHVLVGTIFLIVCLISISASNSPPGTGISSTWCGCSCSSASMSGATARKPWRTARMDSSLFFEARSDAKPDSTFADRAFHCATGGRPQGRLFCFSLSHNGRGEENTWTSRYLH
jgi:cytochrome c oxidase subunit 3